MATAPEEAWYALLRYRMVEAQLRSRGIGDERVLAAMLRTPRHEFIPEQFRGQAYDDHPLPIGEGQTISQPYIVALMLEALALKASDRVLEVGTGSGFVTALLSQLAEQVISVERHASLSCSARGTLARLGYSNVKVIVGDGSMGYMAAMPYDAILVSAATHELPPALAAQLADGGRMIIPIGPPETQQLNLVEMHGDRLQVTVREGCRFVPLIVGDVVKS